MLTLLLTFLPAFASPPADVRRVVLLEGQPWLVGAEPAESQGPWVFVPGEAYLRHWTGPTATASDRIVVGSTWQTGASVCTVEGLAAVTAGHTESSADWTTEREPYCGAPAIWGRLRCDRPPTEAFAVPVGQPTVRAATAEGEVEHPRLVARVRASPSWRAHRALVEQAATALPVEEDVDPVDESVRVYRYAAGDRSWLVVDAEIGWGGGYAPCGEVGGIQRSLSVWTDTKRPKRVSESWSEEQAFVVGLLEVGGQPMLHMANDGSEYLGADLGTMVYPASICICLC